MSLLDNAFAIAYEMGRKKRKRTQDRRDVVLKVATEIESHLIGYDALKMAVMQSKDKKKIVKDADEFIRAELKRVADNG